MEGLGRGDAKEIGDLLDSGQAALIVIGGCERERQLESELTRAEKSVEKEIDADHSQLKRELEAAEKELAGG